MRWPKLRLPRLPKLTDSSKNLLAGAIAIVAILVLLLSAMMAAPHYLGYWNITQDRYERKSMEEETTHRYKIASGPVVEREFSE